MDNVNHPKHYQGGKFEVIDIIDEFTKDYNGSDAFYVGNIIKYVLRSKKKNGVEDLRKAQWYLNRFIALKEVERAFPVNIGTLEDISKVMMSEENDDE